MGFADAWATVRTYINTNWMPTAVKYPNAAFDEPPNDAWVAVSMTENTNGGPASVGPATAELLYRYEGFIAAQIFILENKGMEQALTLADQWRSMFGQGIKTLTGAKEWVHCIAANTVTVGNNNGRYQVNVLIEYQREQFTTGG